MDQMEKPHAAHDKHEMKKKHRWLKSFNLL